MEGKIKVFEYGLIDKLSISNYKSLLLDSSYIFINEDR